MRMSQRSAAATTVHDATTMPVIKQSELVPYTADEMFALIADVESYPEFLPGCERSWVEWRDGNRFRAGMAVRKGKVAFNFRTEQTLEPPHRLDLRLVEGPFRKLEGGWQVLPNVLGCRVSLMLDFEFENRLVGAALSPVFKLMTGALVSSFRERAVKIHGRR